MHEDTSQRKLQIAAEMDPDREDPYIIYDPSTSTWSGVLVDRLRIICKYLHIKCEIYHVPEKKSSGVAVDEFESGVLGEVHEGRADLGLRAISITAERLQHLDMFPSYMSKKYSVVIHEDNLITGGVTSANSLPKLQVLASRDVWSMILLLLLLFIGVGVLFSKVQSLSRRQSISSFSVWRSCSDWAIRVLGTGLGTQGIEDYENTGRSNNWHSSIIVLYAAWLLYSMILLCILTSRLPALFTFGFSLESPFQTLEELTDSNFTVYGTNTVIQVLNSSNVPSRRLLSTKMQLLPKSNKHFTKHALNIQLAKSGRNALILNRENIIEESYLSCSMVVVIEDIASSPIASLILPKDSPFKEQLYRGYGLYKESGLTDSDDQELVVARIIRMRKLRRQHQDCSFRKVNAQRGLESQSINMEQMSTVFLIVVATMSLSLVVLLIEIIIWHQRKRYSRSYDLWGKLSSSIRTSD